MNSFNLLALFIFMSWCQIFAQNTWIQKSGFPGSSLYGGVGFSINDRGYVGIGWNGTVNKDFWEFDTGNNTWAQKSDFGGVSRYGAIGISVNGKGYVGLGNSSSSGYNFKKDFWEYDPINNTWTQKTNFSGAARYTAVAITIGSKAYIGTGWDQSTPYYNDFWEYDPASDSWMQKANLPSSSRQSATGFSLGNKGYLGTGYNDNSLNDFYEYDPGTNTWSQKQSFPGSARYGAAGFSLNNKGYIGSGTNGSSIYSDFFEYDPLCNSWIAVASFPIAGRGSFITFTVNNTAYLGNGKNINNNFVSDFWEYIPYYNPTPSISPSGPLTFCQGDSTILTSSYGNAFLWSNGATTQYITVSSSDNYIVSVTYSNGSSCSAPVAVTESSPAFIVITPNGPTTFCEGDSVLLSATAGSSYLWSNGAITQNIKVFVPGLYSVTVTDANGCPGSSAPITVAVNSNPIPIITANGPTTFCQNGSVILSTSPAINYVWSNGIVTQNNTITSTGNYSVTVTYPNGCSNFSSSTSVNFNAQPPVPEILQNGSTLACTEESMISYDWFFNGNLITTCTSQFCTCTQNGFYTVEITDSNGCSSSSEIFSSTSCALGLNASQDIPRIVIYPNPINKSSSIEIKNIPPGNIEIAVYDLVGKLITKNKVNDSGFQIGNFSFDKGGIYFYEIFQDNLLFARGKLLAQ